MCNLQYLYSAYYSACTLKQTIENMANTKDSSFSLTSNKKPEVSLCSQESIKINPYNEKRHSSVDIMYEYEYDPHSHDVDAHDRSSSKKSATLCSTRSDSKSSQPSIPSQGTVNREIKPRGNANLKDKEDDHDINQTHDSFPSKCNNNFYLTVDKQYVLKTYKIF